MAAILAFLSVSNITLILCALLTIDRALEKLFPNASVLQKADAEAKSLGIKDVDGQ